MSLPSILNTLADGHDLSPEMAGEAFTALMHGEITPAQAGALLLTLRAKGETADEIAAAVRAALDCAHLVTGIEGEYIDIVGTGGDGKFSFNCSTATALTLAGMGYRVVKHGNRAVSSSSGAADALEQLGYPLSLQAEGIKRSIERYGFAFCMAPNFHPGFKNVGPVRRELGVRTIFNLLGPLINPSRPTHMMMGVASPGLVPVIAETLAKGGYKRAIAVCGAGGYDEVTAFGPATAMSVSNGTVSPMEIDPAALGFEPPASEDELRVGSKEEASAVLRDILHGCGPKAMMDMVALNVAVAISLFEPDTDRHLCVERARRAVAEGAGGKLTDNGFDL